MVIEIATDLLIGTLCGGFTMFLNYCLGSPSSKKFSPYEIFSGYTIWLAKRRLNKVGLMHTYTQQLVNGLNDVKKKHERIRLVNDYKKVLYEAAEPFFTWERATGICPVCTGVWITIFASLVFTQNILDLLVIIVISHTTIRILNRIYE